MMVVPASEDVVDRVVRRLKEYAGQCKEEPCLKLLVCGLEEYF